MSRLSRREVYEDLLFLKDFSKSLKPEDGGFISENFTPTLRRRLNARIKRIQIDAIRGGVRPLKTKLRTFFDEQLEAVVSRVESNARRRFGIKNEGDILIPVETHEALWFSAIESELALADVELNGVLEPLFTTTYDEIFVGIMDTFEEPSPAPTAILTEEDKQGLAQQVLRVNESTRVRLRNEVVRAIDGGKTIIETIEAVRDKFPQIGRNRVPTIVRTEIMRTQNIATIRSFKESGVVSHLMVVGCEAIEENSPKFDGIPTCNIRNVPIERAEELDFHPNHTGTIVVDRLKPLQVATNDVPPRREEDEAHIGIGDEEQRELNASDINLVFDENLPLEKYIELFENNDINFNFGREGASLDKVEEFYDSFGLSPMEFNRRFFKSAIALGGDPITEVKVLEDGIFKLSFISDLLTADRVINFNDKQVIHETLKVNRKSTGRGIAKGLLRDHFLLYEELGIEKVSLHANIDVGGYAWFNYGFLPEVDDFSFQSGILDALDRNGTQLLIEAESLGIPSSHEDLVLVRNLVERAQSTEPWTTAEIKTLREVSGWIGDRELTDRLRDLSRGNAISNTIGKFLLLGTSWEGSISLDDREAMEILFNYIN